MRYVEWAHALGIDRTVLNGHIETAASVLNREDFGIVGPPVWAQRQTKKSRTSVEHLRRLCHAGGLCKAVQAAVREWGGADEEERATQELRRLESLTKK